MAKIKITMKIGLDKNGRGVPFEHPSARILLAGIGKEIPEALAKEHGVRKDGTVPEPRDEHRPAVATQKGRPTVTAPRPPKLDEKPIPPVTPGMKKPRLLAIAKRRGLDNLDGLTQEELFEILAKHDAPATPDANAGEILDTLRRLAQEDTNEGSTEGQDENAGEGEGSEGPDAAGGEAPEGAGE